MIWLPATTAPLVTERDSIELWQERRAAAMVPHRTWLERFFRWCWAVVLKTMGHPG